jgi:hypothetical protein
MADQVGLDVSARILDRITDAGLGAEMDDAVELLTLQCCVECPRIGEVDLDTAKLISEIGLLLGQAITLKPGAVIIVDVVDTEHALAACHEAARHVKADEAGGAGDESCHEKPVRRGAVALRRGGRGGQLCPPAYPAIRSRGVVQAFSGLYRGKAGIGSIRLPFRSLRAALP